MVGKMEAVIVVFVLVLQLYPDPMLQIRILGRIWIFGYPDPDPNIRILYYECTFLMISIKKNIFKEL